MCDCRFNNNDENGVLGTQTYPTTILGPIVRLCPGVAVVTATTYAPGIEPETWYIPCYRYACCAARR